MDTKNFIYVILSIQILAIFCIFISFMFYKNVYLVNLVPKLPILTGLLTSTGIVLTYLLFSNSYTKSINDTTLDVVRHDFIGVQQILSDNYDKCPNFVNSLNFDFVKKKFNTTDINYKEYSNENMVTINFLSNVIFESMANYLFTAELTEASDSKWMGVFLSYLSSKQLQERWQYLKYNYGEKPQLLIDFLIKSIEEIKFENSDEVIKFCNDLVFSEEFDKIINHVDRYVVTLQH